ncbi:MAG: hypothetical protein ACRD5H_13575, partial [Nitrososphaerales archaeon]
ILKGVLRMHMVYPNRSWPAATHSDLTAYVTDSSASVSDTAAVVEETSATVVNLCETPFSFYFSRAIR